MRDNFGIIGTLERIKKERGRKSGGRGNRGTSPTLWKETYSLNPRDKKSGKQNRVKQNSKAYCSKLKWQKKREIDCLNQ